MILGGVLQLFCPVNARIGTGQVWQRSAQADKTDQPGDRPAVGFGLGKDG